MKRLLVITLLLCTCIGSIGADINITNVTRAAAVPHGSYLLGTTGLVTRLLPVDTLYAWDGYTTNWTDSSGTFNVSNAYYWRRMYTNGAVYSIYSGTTSNGITSSGVLWGSGLSLTNIPTQAITITTNGAPATNTIVGFFWWTNGANTYKVPCLQ